jgi:hypothetical protein
MLRLDWTYVDPITEVDAALESALFIRSIAFSIKGHIEWNLRCVPSAKKENGEE